MRLGFDPPEDEEEKKREKEWVKQFQKQQQQIKVDWEDYEKDPANAAALSPSKTKSKEKDEKEKEDKGDKKEDKKKSSGGISSMLSSAMKPSIKKLVRHGIPSELRATIWFEKSGASKKKKENPGVYAKYVQEIDPDSQVAEEIQMDIARTFTMHLMFANQATKRMMLRTLSAFTVRNPNYGYCQNMTFIVGIILFFLPEEDAFWLFTTIMEDILFVDFCSPTMIGLRVDQKVLEILIRERLPKLYSHFTKHDIDISCFTTSWLLRLFVNVFPMETTLRVWDCFLFEGSKILFRVALAYLKLHEEQLRQCTDSGAVMTFLSSECKMFYDADRLIKACASFWALRRKQINELRARFIEELEELARPMDSDAFANNDSKFSSESKVSNESIESWDEKSETNEITTKLETTHIETRNNETINNETTQIETTKNETTHNETTNNETTTSEPTNNINQESEGNTPFSTTNPTSPNIFNNDFESDDEYDLC